MRQGRRNSAPILNERANSPAALFADGSQEWSLPRRFRASTSKVTVSSKVELRAGESLADDTKKQAENAKAMAQLQSNLNAAASTPRLQRQASSGSLTLMNRRARSSSHEPPSSRGSGEEGSGSETTRMIQRVADRVSFVAPKRIFTAGPLASALNSSTTAERSSQEIHHMLMNHFKVRHMKVDATKDVRKESIGLARAQNLYPYDDAKVFHWNVTVLILTISETILVPYFMSFESGSIASRGNKTMLAIDCIIDVFFMLDIFAQFRVTRPTVNDELRQDPLMTDRVKVRQAYLNGHFCYDFLCFFPFHLLPIGGARAFVLLRIPRIFCISKLRRILHDMSTNLSLRRWLVYSPMSSVIRLVQLIGVILLITHWSICVWHSVTARTSGGVWMEMMIDERAENFARIMGRFSVNNSVVKRERKVVDAALTNHVPAMPLSCRR
jgi:hypothetical protein